MKKTGHPEYVRARVVCSCGETFETRATKPEIKIEICSKCHPFYLGTGRQRLVDTGGRVERFQKKYGEYQPRGKKTSEDSGEVQEELEAVVEEAPEVAAVESNPEDTGEAAEAAEQPVDQETVEA